MQNLQAKVELLTRDNERLHSETSTLREELINLKTMLLAHKTCSNNPQAVIDAINRPIPGITPPSLRSSLPPTATAIAAPTTTANSSSNTATHTTFIPPANNNVIQPNYNLNTTFYTR